MPIITDPQKLSMPEQVQRNKHDIKEIFKKIDGLDSLDNVVEVPSMSHILTAKELEAIRQPVAFISYDGKVYLKAKEENNSAYFEMVFQVSGSNQIDLNSEEITVNLTNGALGIVSSAVSTYSKAQLDSKLSEKADLTGANFSGTVISETLEQRIANYTQDLTLAQPTNANFEWEDVFSKFKVINGMAYLIFNFKIKNLTASAVAIYLLTNREFLIPTEVASKIFDINGNSASQALSAAANIANVAASINKTTPQDSETPTFVNASLFNATNANGIGLRIGIASGYSVPANTTIMVSGRIPLTLI